MKRGFVALLLALALPLGASAPAAAKKAWTEVVTATEQGTYVLGNPAAKVKLVEYFSFTCAHCADLSREAMPTLKRRYIASGQVSLELRNAVRDRFDLVASLLSRCTGARGVFAASEALMAQQPIWMKRAIAFESANRDRLAAMPQAEALSALAQGSGMRAMLHKYGLIPAAAKRCLADEQELGRLSAIAAEAWRDRKIEGTPTVLMNDAIVAGGASWRRLEPAIAAALK